MKARGDGEARPGSSSESRFPVPVPGTPLQSHSHQLHLQAAILNDVDARSREPLGGFIVSDPKLHPHRARALGDDVVDVWRHMLRSPEDVHDVDVAGDVDQAPIDTLAEDLGDVRVVDRNRYRSRTRPPSCTRERSARADRPASRA